MLKLTKLTDKHEASLGLFATAELLVNSWQKAMWYMHGCQMLQFGREIRHLYQTV